MVKSLLLGSAAGVVVVTMGEASAPVKYVKVCRLYAAGFYEMPGTGFCLKMASWARAEATYGSNQTGSLAWGPFNANLRDRTTNNFQVRARYYVTADARGQTAYGVVRGYLAVGTSTNDASASRVETTFAAQWLAYAGQKPGPRSADSPTRQARHDLYRQSGRHRISENPILRADGRSQIPWQVIR